MPAATAAAEPLELPPGFKPIEGAPRNGALVIVWDPKPSAAYGPDIHPAFWNAEYDCWEAAAGTAANPRDINPLGWRL